MRPASATVWILVTGAAVALLLGAGIRSGGPAAPAEETLSVRSVAVVTPMDPDDPAKEDEAKPRKCDPLEIDCKISKAIDGWFRALAKAGIKAVFNSLGKNLLQTPRVDELPRVGDIWAQSAWVANTCFVLLIVAGGLLVMGYETLQTSYTVKDIAPRLVIGFTAANFSEILTGQAIEFANQLARALLGPGVDAARAMKTMGDRLSGDIAGGSIFFVLVILVAVFLAVALAVIFALRVTITIVLVAGAPLALACHALPQTEGLALLWWRAFAGVLGIQVAQALVFVVALKVVFTPNSAVRFEGTDQMWDLLIVVCLLYVLVRIPSWITTQIWSGGLRRSPAGRVARYVAYRHMISSSVRRNSPRRS